MKILSWTEIPQVIAKSLNKWVLYISWHIDNETDFYETLKAAPYLDINKHFQVLMDGCGIIVCDSEEECRKLFKLTVGDDGPTESNPYNGPANVYALVINNNGVSLTENT